MGKFAQNQNNFLQNVYAGYGYLWQGKEEIVTQQLIVDPIQDVGIKMLTNFLVKTKEAEHPTANNGHGHSHGCSHGHSHGNGGFINEWLFHSQVKLISTIFFPIIYSFSKIDALSGLPTSLSYINIPFKFMGINPLEGIYVANDFLKSALGKDNIIYNNQVTNYFTNGYIDLRSENVEYADFMDSYRSFMESIDSALHVKDNFDVYMNNDILKNPVVAKKAAIHVGGLAALYYHTEKAQEAVDGFIHNKQLKSNAEATLNDNLLVALNTFISHNEAPA